MDEEEEYKKSRMLAIHIGKFFSNDGAKEDYNQLQSEETTRMQKENGELVLEGEVKVEMARNGYTPDLHAPITLGKRVDNRSEFQKENNIQTVGDTIE